MHRPESQMDSVRGGLLGIGRPIGLYSAWLVIFNLEPFVCRSCAVDPETAWANGRDQHGPPPSGSSLDVRLRASPAKTITKAERIAHRNKSISTVPAGEAEHLMGPDSTIFLLVYRKDVNPC